MKELSRIVMPTENFIGYSELFVKKNDEQCYMNGALTNVNEYKFNTWMNLFAAKKYYYYCELGELYLKLNIEGDYILQIVGSKRNFAFDRIDNIIINQSCSGNVCTKVPDAEQYDGIFFTILEDKQNPIRFKEASWCTDKDVQRSNKLAIVTCTYKRENFINKNIELFKEFIDKNTQLQDKIKLIVVDNGKTLVEDKSNNLVKIISNINAGGAGGFTRGLIDIIEQETEFTRVLFMDDDVEIFPETFYKTLMLSNYLKDEYKDSFINGAMMDLYEKNKFFENISMQEQLWLTGYCNEADATKYDNILKTNDIPPQIFGDKNKYVSSAWWYCSFPLNFSSKKGLPVPVFFRGDDAEWSWRACGAQIISMNGICIWHAAFKWRVSKIADYYYLPRNMFFINSIYNKNFKKYYKKYFIDRLNYLLDTYDYASLEILIQAMKDILKGSSVFKENPEKQFMEINKIAKQIKYEVCTNNKELENAKYHRVHASKWRKLLWKCTSRGKFCPKFLYKKQGVALEWYPPIEDFILVNRVKVFNLFTRKFELRRFDRKKTLFYRKTFYILLRDIDNNYKKLHDDFVEAHKEFSTIAFWKKYLEMDN